MYVIMRLGIILYYSTNVNGGAHLEEGVGVKWELLLGMDFKSCRFPSISQRSLHLSLSLSFSLSYLIVNDRLINRKNSNPNCLTTTLVKPKPSLFTLSKKKKPKLSIFIYTTRTMYCVVHYFVLCSTFILLVINLRCNDAFHNNIKKKIYIYYIYLIFIKSYKINWGLLTLWIF